MIVNFALSNHLSFYREQVLSFVASSLEGREDAVTETRFGMADRILPVAAIFGANASGKSNLLGGMRFMQQAVRSSVESAAERYHVPRRCFKLNSEAVDEASTFELAFIKDQVLYQYGFNCTDDEFVGEWLYAYPNKRKQVWFERNGATFEFGQNLKGQNVAISEITRKDSLFLSAASKFKHPQLRIVSDYILSLDINLNYTVSEFDIHKRFASEELDPRAIKFLQLLNTGIVRFERIQQEPMPEELRSKLNSFNRAVEELLGQGAKAEIVGEQHNVRFVHQSADGNGVQFEADEESAGSRRLILLLHQVFSALDSGGTLVVDELDASLHTQACRQVVRLFLDKDLNQHGAQLIFTTHDTNVLADGLLRRDEVWIVEKDVAGESHLYPLTDFKLRKTENVERIYLEGRLGGIPDKFDVNWLLADG